MTFPLQRRGRWAKPPRHPGESALLEAGENVRYAISPASLLRSLQFFLGQTQLVHRHLSVQKIRKSVEPKKRSGHITPQSTPKRPVPHMQDLYMRERVSLGGQNLESVISACLWPRGVGGVAHGSLPSSEGPIRQWWVRGDCCLGARHWRFLCLPGW